MPFVSYFFTLCFRTLYVFIGIYLATGLRAQTAGFDSLQLVLKNAKHDTTRIRSLEALKEVCDRKEVLQYVEKALKLCQEAYDKRSISRRFYIEHTGISLDNMGTYYKDQGDQLKAMEYYKKALALTEELEDKKTQAYVLNNIALLHTNSGNIQAGLDCYYRNLKLLEDLGDKEGLAFTLNNVGFIYFSQVNNEKALEYYEKALKVFREINHKKGIALTLVNSGQVYARLNQPEKSIKNYEEGIAIYREIGDYNGVAFATNSVGNFYYLAGDLDKAIEQYRTSLAIAEEYQYKTHIISSLIYLSRTLLKAGELKEALPYAMRGLALSKDGGNPRDIEAAAKTLKKIYKQQHQFENAFTMYQLEIQMHDSIQKQSLEHEALKKELEYQYEKKELQNKVKQEQRLSVLKLDNEKKNSKKNMIVYGLIFLALILGVSIFYLYKFFQQKNIINANRNNELKQKLLLSQMNPHFIFNSVDNIQSLIMQKQDEEAVSYLGKFSKLTRQILENSAENYITLAEELAMTENYLSIQRLLYNNIFTYTITVDESIDTEQILLPPMLTQPFIENAIKHGMKHKDTNGKIEVRFYRKGEALYFEVIDNGPGLEKKDENDAHRSMAISIVTERLKHHAGKKEIVIEINNYIENNKVAGVRSAFEIPYIYDN